MTVKPDLNGVAWKIARTAFWEARNNGIGNDAALRNALLAYAKAEKEWNDRQPKHRIRLRTDGGAEVILTCSGPPIHEPKGAAA